MSTPAAAQFGKINGAAAQEAGNTPVTMAIADTIMKIQMAGCSR